VWVFTTSILEHGAVLMQGRDCWGQMVVLGGRRWRLMVSWAVRGGLAVIGRLMATTHTIVEGREMEGTWLVAG